MKSESQKLERLFRPENEFEKLKRQILASKGNLKAILKAQMMNFGLRMNLSSSKPMQRTKRLYTRRQFHQNYYLRGRKRNFPSGLNAHYHTKCSSISVLAEKFERKRKDKEKPPQTKRA